MNKNNTYDLINENFLKLYENFDVKKAESEYLEPFVFDLEKLNKIPPHNPFSNAFYSPFNSYLLNISAFNLGFKTNAWATFKQIQNLGGFVKEGQKATTIIRPIHYYYLVKPAKNEYESFDIIKKISFKEYQNLDDEHKHKETFFIGYKVFNFEQTKNLEHLYLDIKLDKFNSKFEKKSLPEFIINKLNPNIDIGNSLEAYYIPKYDIIKIPEPKLFLSDDFYYSTLFHEIGHWTGHENRLNRQNHFNDNIKNSEILNYAYEEAVAEMFSFYMSQFSGIKKNVKKVTLPYIKEWFSIINEDKTFLVKAMGEASKASEYVLEKTGLKKELSNELFEKLKKLKEEKKLGKTLFDDDSLDIQKKQSKNKHKFNF